MVGSGWILDKKEVLLEHFRELYPFEGNFIDIDGLKYHYIDEGEGDPVVMLHGNPTWSFYYRNLISGLRGTCRTIVPDHIGCGLSDKPQNYSYTLVNHIANLEVLLEKLQVKNVTLVLHDWGGAIGMGWAVRHPELVKRVVVLNTAAFILPFLPFRINICRIPIFGDIAIRAFNAFAGMAVYMACNKRDRMTPEVKAGYLAPYNSYGNRIATLRFVQDIPMGLSDASYPLVKNIERELWRFKDTPMLIIWGEKDFCFNKYFLRRWRKLFPAAKVITIADAGHYVLEDAWERILPSVKDFFESNPLENSK